MTENSEFVLINRVLAGEHQLYAELVNRYQSFAFTIALKIVENRPEAEEIAQDGFIKAFKNLSRFNQEAKFSTWLYRIVFNTAITYKRKGKQQFQSIEKTIIPHRQEADGNLELEDKRKFIKDAMTSLNATDRLVITLFYLKELSLDEIAEVTAMQTNTVKVRLHRARLRLGDELQNLLKKEALTL